MAATVLAALSMTPWFYASTKAYVVGVPYSTMTRHPNWKAAMRYVRAHARSGDVVIASFALLARYYGPPLPLYHLNNNMLDIILRDNLRDGQGRLLEYTSGAPAITDLATLRTVLGDHRGAWFVTEKFRFHSPTPTPIEIREYIEATCQLWPVAVAPDMIIWYCRRSATVSSPSPG